MLDILIKNSRTSILQWMVQTLKAFSLSPVFLVHFVISSRQAVAYRLICHFFRFELSVWRKLDRRLREFAWWQVIQKHYLLRVMDTLYVFFRSVRFTLSIHCSMFTKFCARLCRRLLVELFLSLKFGPRQFPLTVLILRVSESRLLEIIHAVFESNDRLVLLLFGDLQSWRPLRRRHDL